MKWAVSMSSTTIDRNILASMGMTSVNDREQELFINAITKRYRQSLRLIGIMAIIILLGFITIIFTIGSIYGKVVVTIFGMIVFIFAGIISRVLLGNQREELRRLNTMKIEKVSAEKAAELTLAAQNEELDYYLNEEPETIRYKEAAMEELLAESNE